MEDKNRLIPSFFGLVGHKRKLQQEIKLKQEEIRNLQKELSKINSEIESSSEEIGK